MITEETGPQMGRFLPKVTQVSGRSFGLLDTFPYQNGRNS